MPKTYDPEFKSRAVRLVRDHLADYGSVTAASLAVCAQLGVSGETLRRWVTKPRSTMVPGPVSPLPRQRRSADARRRTSGCGRPTRSSRPPGFS